jgi:alpha-galactosidase
VNRKIVGLGGGSLYFCRVLADLALEQGISGSEVVLYDIDFEKADKMAAMGRRLTEEAGTGLRVRAAAELADAVDGADFAISSIGGSGVGTTKNVSSSSYHASDLEISMKYGISQIIGDTCGPAGMMMALRAVPAYMSFCRELEKRAPDVILLNHSNPMAVLMRAIHKYTPVHAYGICHGVQGGIIAAAELLGVTPEELECTWIGTNHYYWFTRVVHRGRDITADLLKRTREQNNVPGSVMAGQLSGMYGHRIAYSSDDHIIEFYPFLSSVRGLDDLPYQLKQSALDHDSPLVKADGSEIAQALETRADYLEAYQEALDKTVLPASPERGLTGEGLASFISAIANARRQPAIVNVANNGAIPNLPAHAEVEVEGLTDSLGVRSLVMGEAPPVLKGILEKRFAWQELVADAAVTGDRNAALQALLIDEMAIWPDKASDMLEELLAASKDLLPQFFK